MQNMARAPTQIVGDGHLARQLAQMLGLIVGQDVFLRSLFFRQGAESITDPLQEQILDAIKLGPTYFAIGYADPRSKLQLLDFLTHSGVKLMSYKSITPCTWDAQIGQGCILMGGIFLGVDVSVGDATYIGANAVISEGVSIGRGSYISPGAVVCGGVVIGEGVFIGAGSIIANDIEIGSLCKINAGSCVTRSMPSGQTWLERRVHLSIMET